MDLLCYQIRTIILFQFYCKKSVTECPLLMCTALDITIVSYDTLKVCYQKFKIKDYDIQEEELLGQPTDDGEAHLQEVVEKDQHSTT